MKFLILLIALANFSWANSPPLIPDHLVPAYILSPSQEPLLIAEKNQGVLHVFRGNKHIQSYPMTSGLLKGDKWQAGDRKTPLGIYILERKISPEALNRIFGQKADIYGSGAIALNYPNPHDKKQHKTGANIWLHGTNEAGRVLNPQSSQGCLVVSNENFNEILMMFKAKKIVVVITEDLELISKETQSSYPQTYPLIKYKDQLLQIKGQARYLGSVDEAFMD